MNIKNKKVLLDLLFLISILTGTLPCRANSQIMKGSETGNGGDPLEQKFDEIAVNIKQWIEAGNSADVILPNSVTHEMYEKEMVSAINRFAVSFTSNLVEVDGVEKVCRNWVTAEDQAQILCSRSFEKLPIEQQYVLVHHELAGLAGLEMNRNSSSDYRISNQVSAFLAVEKVKRLPIVSNLETSLSGVTFAKFQGLIETIPGPGPKECNSCYSKGRIKSETYRIPGDHVYDDVDKMLLNSKVYSRFSYLFVTSTQNWLVVANKLKENSELSRNEFGVFDVKTGKLLAEVVFDESWYYGKTYSNYQTTIKYDGGNELVFEIYRYQGKYRRKLVPLQF